MANQQCFVELVELPLPQINLYSSLVLCNCAYLTLHEAHIEFSAAEFYDLVCLDATDRVPSVLATSLLT